MNQEKAAAIRAKDLTVAIDGKTIIKDVGFSLEQGEFVAIIGPNGAGKSTLLRSLRGMIGLTDGEVSLQGRALRAMKEDELARTVAYMQQEVNVGFGYTALDIVLAGRYPYLKWWQNESEADRQIALKYMEFTGVREFAEKPVRQLSGGERQRILLAKVLTQETPLIFLDEPTASLDLLYQEEIFRSCQEMCSNGKTILIVAHDLKMAARFCSRLLLFAKGRLLADGTPEAVITEKNLAEAYGLQASVYVNQITGNLDIHTYSAAQSSANGSRVHVIGGGGAATLHLRQLYELGYRLSCGVLQSGDSDAEAAAAFAEKSVVGQAFSSIDRQQGAENRRLIEEAEWTLLSGSFFGEQNLDNLKAAREAKKLIIIEDTPIEERDFTGGEAVRLYRELLSSAQTTVLTTQQFQTSLAVKSSKER